MTEPTYAPPPVKGYRALSQTDVDLMNEIKAEGERLQQLILKIEGHLRRTEGAEASPEQERQDAAQPARWLAIGRTQLQQGLMAVTRAVAQPTTF